MKYFIGRSNFYLISWYLQVNHACWHQEKIVLECHEVSMVNTTKAEILDARGFRSMYVWNKCLHPNIAGFVEHVYKIRRGMFDLRIA